MYQTEANQYSNRVLEEINLKREMMIKSAEVYGFTSEETIYQSQELDKLIFKYQSTFHDKAKQMMPIRKSLQLLVWPQESLTSDIVFV